MTLPEADEFPRHTRYRYSGQRYGQDSLRRVEYIPSVHDNIRSSLSYGRSSSVLVHVLLLVLVYRALFDCLLIDGRVNNHHLR